MIERKVAIVTGGSSGIGRATCIALARVGYQIVVVGTNSQRIRQTVEQINHLENNQTDLPHIGAIANVTSAADMQAMASNTIEQFGRIDLLVASAGIGKSQGTKRVVPHPTASLPLVEWEAAIAVNLTGVFLSNRAVLPAMMARGSGQIINICSSTTPRGLRGQPYAPAYCASKFGVVGFTEALAEEVSEYGIRVQALFPGYVRTSMVAETALLHRYGGSMSAEDFAQTIIYLVQQNPDATIRHPHAIPVGSIALKKQ